MNEPVVRCRRCDYVVDPKGDFCWRCGALLSVDDIRAIYESIEVGSDS